MTLVVVSNGRFFTGNVLRNSNAIFTSKRRFDVKITFWLRGAFPRDLHVMINLKHFFEGNPPVIDAIEVICGILTPFLPNFVRMSLFNNTCPYAVFPVSGYCRKDMYLWGLGCNSLKDPQWNDDTILLKVEKSWNSTHMIFISAFNFWQWQLFLCNYIPQGIDLPMKLSPVQRRKI